MSQSQKVPGPTLAWSTEMYFTCKTFDALKTDVL